MPRKLENEIQRIEHDAQGMSSSNSYSQPWWRGFGNNDDSPASITEGTMNSSLKQLQFSVPTGIIQTQTNGGRGANVNKEEPSSIASKSGSDGNAGQEKQNFKNVPSSGASTIIEHLEPNSQMELVGHSIVLTSYPYTDPHYGGTMTPYGLQPMVHPYLYGMHQTRMPLPLEMEEEPVYVNAKQYHGILRRRQSRAKAELEKKVIKNRKPYLHESRHQHAMRRARGCGGRFLNKKKLDDDAANPTSEKGTNECATNSSEAANSAGSEDLSTYSISGHQGDSMVQNAHQGQTFTNVNSDRHGLSSIYYSSADGSEDGNFVDQQRGRMQANGAKQRALPIK